MIDHRERDALCDLTRKSDVRLPGIPRRLRR